MKYIADHDYHIHSQLSSCSSDPEQTKERLLKYAEENGFSQLCVTDHFWDERVLGASRWYQPQNLAHVSQSLPLPQGAHTVFHFGCETDFDKTFTLGIAKETFDRFDFVIVPTSHMHMLGVTLYERDFTIEGLTRLYVERIEALLGMDLPFHKMGWAHPTCQLLAPTHFEDHLKVLNGISDDTFARIFAKIAQKGMGVELNMPIFEYSEQQLPDALRPYRIAKDCGCKFYLGSDAHHPKELKTAKAGFERIIELLELTEADKFRPFG